MAKIAVITDTHFGVRNDSHGFYDYFKQFNDDVFFKTIDDLGIKTVIHLGDVFDRRKYMNFVTAKRAREDFFEPLNNRGLDCHFIVGNHDTTYKNTNEVNSLREVLHGYETFKLYTRHTEIHVEGIDILLVPWVCEQTRVETVKMLNESKAPVVFGHLSINGFEQDRGNIHDGQSVEDFEKSVFNRFSVVASGHFHHKSSYDNIHYLGAAYEFKWSDYNDQRGFHVFDTEDMTFEFKRNPYRKFFMVGYDDTNNIEKVQTDIKETDFSYLASGYVKIVVANRTNPYLFDLFVDKIYKAQPIDISVVEDISAFAELDPDSEIEEIEDTQTLINQYIDGLQLSMDETGMKRFRELMNNIYSEAMVLEEF